VTPCAVPGSVVPFWYHMDRLTAAVARAIEAAPGTLRALGRAAGLSHVQLLRLTRGERTATPDVAGRIAKALEAWGAECARAAAGIRRAAQTRARRTR